MKNKNIEDFKDKIFNEYKPFFVATSSCKKFENKKQDRHERDGFLFEAITFLVFNKIYDNDTKIITETKEQRTPDFLIENNGTQYYVEATHLKQEDDDEEKRTGLPHNRQTSGDEAYHLYPDLQKLRSTIHCKDDQFKKHKEKTNNNGPCVLCTGTYNEDGHILRRTSYTKELFYFEPIHSPEWDVFVSPFYSKSNSGIVTPANENISAILFFAVRLEKKEIRIHGILHPSPHQEFDISLLPGIPFWKQNGGYTKNEDVNPYFVSNQDNKPERIKIVNNVVGDDKQKTAAIDMNELLSQL